MMTFDMQTIGRKISALRKEKNMTQMDLADNLGISFQAVSNWERGLTMPDISKLPELAALFGVTVDEILGNEEAAKAVADLTDGKSLENADGKTIAEIAPIVKPKQLKETVNNNKKNIDISALIVLAPFLDANEIYEMIQELSVDCTLSIKDIAALAPFMDEDDIGEIANKAADSGENTMEDLTTLAPFMDEGDIGKIALKLFEKGVDTKHLAELAPFMDEKDIGKIAMKLADRGNGSVEQIAPLAPFMGDSDINKIAKKLAVKGKDSIAPILALAPFMDSDDIMTTVKILIKNGTDGSSVKKLIEMI